MDLEPANFDVLEKRYPALARRLRDTAPADLPVMQTQGFANIVKDGSALYPESPHPAEVEKQRWTASYPSDRLFFIVYGLVPPYPIEALLSRHEFEVLIIERDAGVARRVMQVFDVTRILAHPHVRLCVSDQLVEIGDACTRWCLEIGSTDINAFLAPAERDRDFYLRLHDRLDRVTASVTSDIRTIRASAPYYARFIFKNLPRLLESRTMSVVTDSVQEQDIPALLIGSGPSLDRNLPAIAAFRSKGLLISADSAWPVLARHGIRPDVICTTDQLPDKHAVFDADPGSIPVLTVPEVHPDLIASIQNPVFVSRGLPLADAAGELAGGIPVFREPIRDVIHFGFQAARLMFHARRITLVGCDLCYEGENHHAKATGAFVAAPSGARCPAPGVQGQVITTSMFLECAAILNSYAWACAHEREGGAVLINSSEGLALDGWTCRPLHEVVAELPDLSCLGVVRDQLMHLPPVKPLTTPETWRSSLEHDLEAYRCYVDETIAHLETRLGPSASDLAAADGGKRLAAPLRMVEALVHTLSFDLQQRLIALDRTLYFTQEPSCRARRRLERAMAYFRGIHATLQDAAVMLRS